MSARGSLLLLSPSSLLALCPGMENVLNSCVAISNMKDRMEGVGVFRVTIIENGASAKNINIFPQITDKFYQTNKCGILMTIMAQIHLSGTF